MIKNILFDFDGVIVDSMPIRDNGFRVIFKDFDTKSVEKLIKYHNKNGGLSRYVKIKHFFEDILGLTIDKQAIITYADNFSNLMKEELTNKKYLIKEVVDFINKNQSKYNIHIVSGSDEIELRFLCDKLGINSFFRSIHGSPTPKSDLIKLVLNENSYKKEETILIGDSNNDLEAAEINKIFFYGYNNKLLKNKTKNYIETFNIFEII